MYRVWHRPLQVVLGSCIVIHCMHLLLCSSVIVIFPGCGIGFPEVVECICAIAEVIDRSACIQRGSSLAFSSPLPQPVRPPVMFVPVWQCKLRDCTPVAGALWADYIPSVNGRLEAWYNNLLSGRDRTVRLDIGDGWSCVVHNGNFFQVSPLGKLRPVRRAVVFAAVGHPRL
jgi:hypothetical protein